MKRGNSDVISRKWAFCLVLKCRLIKLLLPDWRHSGGDFEILEFYDLSRSYVSADKSQNLKIKNPAIICLHGTGKLYNTLQQGKLFKINKVWKLRQRVKANFPLLYAKGRLIFWCARKAQKALLWITRERIENCRVLFLPNLSTVFAGIHFIKTFLHTSQYYHFLISNFAHRNTKVFTIYKCRFTINPAAGSYRLYSFLFFCSSFYSYWTYRYFQVNINCRRKAMLFIEK